MMKIFNYLIIGFYSVCFVISYCGLSYSQALNGSYTVGGSSPDFATLQDAAHALFVNGMSGPVKY